MSDNEPSFLVSAAPTLQELDATPQFLLIPPSHVGLLHTPQVCKDWVAQTFTASDLPSLEDYLARMVTDPSRLGIYVDVAGRSVVCRLDGARDAEMRGINEHHAVLNLELSPEFKPIYAVVGKPQNQEEFLNFIEAQSHLFMESSRLLELVSAFRQYTVTKFKSARNLVNGTLQMEFSTEEDGEQTTKMPALVHAIVPVFTAQADVTLDLTLRYQVKAGVVTFFLGCPGVETLIRQQVELVESRLRSWVHCMAVATAPDTQQTASSIQRDMLDWSKVLVVRGRLITDGLEKERNLEVRGLPASTGAKML